MTEQQKHSLNHLNRFTQGENRVWFDASAGNVDFAYSDGQEIEQRLRDILSNAQDLSHLSYELKAHISDWPTEYHLSPVRSNLIRALNLSGVKRVLELGCGCGSITRYLGDYRHSDGSTLQVDSVEGSPVRAELAALRCRDLPNVNVATANFNDITFPEDYYDLVLYVGVTEYAGKFSNRETDEEALQDLLALAKRAATDDGVVMVAIENRTGFKYVEGANEDHYAKPYIGIHNYAQPAGIRTYTKKEWQAQMAAAGFSETEFIYPFPDYKVPTIFLGEQYVDENPYSHNHLETCRSRDYIKDFHYASKEALFWESTAAAKTLGDYANSFMLLMSTSAASIAQMSPNDFLHLPTYQRKLAFCMSIAKPKGQDHIVRDYIVDDPVAREHSAADLVHQCIEQEHFVPGPLLSVEWSRSLISYPYLSVFENYLRDYFAFLERHQSAGTLTIDLLPNNILLDVVAEGEASDMNSHSIERYRVVDEEWKVSEALTATYVYFRAILFFYTSYPDFVEEKAIPEKYRQTFTLEDWLRYGFRVIGKQLSVEELLRYANANEQFQNHISDSPFEIDFDTLLDKASTVMALRWQTSGDDQAVKHDNYLEIPGKGYFAPETLCFQLPSQVRSLTQLQFFPSGSGVVQEYSFFRVYSVRLVAVNAAQQQRELWSLENAAEIASQAELSDMVFEQGELGEGFYAHQYYPSLTWQLSELEQELAHDETLQVLIEARFPVTGYTQTLLRRSKELLPLEFKLTELDQIKNSQSYALALKISALVNWLRSVKAALLPNRGTDEAKKKALTSSSQQNWCTEKAEIPSARPRVSIIIPFRDEAGLLNTCIRSVVANTEYDNYEIIAVSNDSVHADTEQVRQQLTQEFPQCRFIDHNAAFNFSALVNEGVSQSQGEYVVLLNNDVQLQTSRWLDDMLAKALLPKVGVVGGRLNFPDGRIQHLGLHIGANLLPEHTFKEQRVYEFGLGPYVKKARYVTAVTGAMLLCSRSLWDELLGFDEQDFGVAFNDVDFCLRAKAAGYASVLEPKAYAIHQESASRGYETTVKKMRRFAQEQQAFIARHRAILEQNEQ